MVRALFAAFDGPLYLLQRVSDYKNLSIGVLTPGGFANATAQEKFWSAAACSRHTRFLFLPTHACMQGVIGQSIPLATILCTF